MKETDWILSGFSGVNFPKQFGAVAVVGPEIESKLLEAAEIASQAVVRSGKMFSRYLGAINRGRYGERKQIQFFHHGLPFALSHRDDFQSPLGLRQSREPGPQHQL